MWNKCVHHLLLFLLTVDHVFTTSFSSAIIISVVCGGMAIRAVLYFPKPNIVTNFFVVNGIVSL